MCLEGKTSVFSIDQGVRGRRAVMGERKGKFSGKSFSSLSLGFLLCK